MSNGRAAPPRCCSNDCRASCSPVCLKQACCCWRVRGGRQRPAFVVRRPPRLVRRQAAAPVAGQGGCGRARAASGRAATAEERATHPPGSFGPSKKLPPHSVGCHDPGTRAKLGSGVAHVGSPAEAREASFTLRFGSSRAPTPSPGAGQGGRRRGRARGVGAQPALAAAQAAAHLRRFVLDSQADICAAAARDSGRPLVYAAFKQVLVACSRAFRWATGCCAAESRCP